MDCSAVSNFPPLEFSHWLSCSRFSPHLEEVFSRVEVLRLVPCIFDLSRYCQIVLQGGCACISMSSHCSRTQAALGTRSLFFFHSCPFDGGKQGLIFALSHILSPVTVRQGIVSCLLTISVSTSLSYLSRSFVYFPIELLVFSHGDW